MRAPAGGIILDGRQMGMKEQIEHILLVDDDQDDKYFFATALEEVDPSVKLSTASEGGEAFEKLRDFTPDLILLDLVMPGINGITFLKLVSRDKRLSKVPVIVYTSDLSIFDEQEVLKLGADKVVIKANDYMGTVENISTLLKIRPLKQTA
jgi:CheY-like chemotaxis protein